jgi:hypothetical protein
MPYIESDFEDDVEEIVHYFNKNEPEMIDDVRNLGFKLKHLGSGLFRDAYLLKGHELIVKVPQDDGYCGWNMNFLHTKKEIANIKRIKRNKKYRPLWRYLPRIHYYNKESGLVLMERYYEIKNWKLADQITTMLSNLVDDLLGSDSDNDIHSQNVFITQDESPVLIDLGYF